MNKKLIATLVMSTVVASAFAVNAGATSDKQVLKDEKGTVHTIQGKLGKVSGASAEDRAFAAIEKVKADHGLKKSAKESFKVLKSEKDDLGVTHTKMDRAINGLTVFNNEVIVHEKAGDVQGVSGAIKELSATSLKSDIDTMTAIDAAVKSTGFDGALINKPEATLGYVAQGDNAVLAYKVGVRYMGKTPGNWTIFVNANDGSIVDSYNAIHQVVGTGTGVLGDTKSINTTLRSGLYYMEDTTKAMYAQGGIIDTYDWKNTTTNQYYLSDSDNVWNTTAQRAGVDAHFYAGKTYDYYKNTLGRNSYNNAGATLYSGVHYSTNYNNAFWNGQEMTYGDGDGVQFRALSGAYDVVAHELTHAVTEYTSKLVYQNQSGALNESWSDAIASVVDSADWLIGEDVYTPATAGDALRSMSNPTLYNQPAHMNNYNNTTSDNGGVHINSGIPNKAFYNYVTAIGSRDVAGKVWYRAATSYMTSNSTFSQARAATLNAAAALYGTSSTYYTQLATAWSNVGVY
jgi:thermolysin